MRTVAICNQKGGVGKSTTAYHLARAAVLQGQRVLLVDADPQGNLTSVISQDVSPDQVGLADVLSSRTDVQLKDVVYPGIWEHLQIVPTPSGRNLGMVRDELVVAGVGRERRLGEALATIAGDYDLCLIDCPPSLDQLTLNALTAADSVIVVSHARLWATDGLAHLLETIRDVRQYYNPSVSVAGVIVNQYEERTIAGRHWLSELAASAEALGFRVLEPPIPKRVVIADATEASAALDEWGADGPELAAIYAQHLKNLLHEEGVQP